MTREEYEEFYRYITIYSIYETEEREDIELKEKLWESIKHMPIEVVRKNTRNVYKHFMTPCNINRLSPKVFTGENPNPGLYGKIEVVGVN